jgi:UDP-N-acetylglucosamine 2-epimerase (non-hydrolysing)
MYFIIYGTRPEYIKLYPLVLALQKSNLSYKFICTNQHAELVEKIEDQIGVKPDIRLNVFESGQSLGSLAAKITLQLEAVFKEYTPTLCFAQGDTISAFLAGLTAFQHGVKVAHVEAGLRTYNLNQPFPEEGYRQMLSRISDFNFCTSDISKNNLISENINESKISVVGNTVIDSLEYVKVKLNLENKNWTDKKTVLVTSHRRENWGQKEEDISTAIFTLAKNHPELDFVWPMHPNPILRESIFKIKERFAVENVSLIEPLEYLDLVKLMNQCRIIVTDSGGIQEESPSFGIPVIVTREATERPEGVTAGFAHIVGTDKDKIISTFEALYKDFEHEKFAKISNPYGNGTTSEQILDILATSMQ